MARPREFDTDDAIARAMDVFWTHGYHEASLPDLLDGMGLTRGSLYKAFTDKKSLFLTVLNHYDTQAVDAAVALLSDPQISDGWDRIDALFGAIVQAVAAGDHRGCLLCSAAAGPASYDADIADVVDRSLARMEAAFEIALKSTPNAPPIAPLLVTHYIGVRILARSARSGEQVARAVKEMRHLRDMQ